MKRFNPEKLRKIRLERGYTLKEAAEAIGYKHPSSLLYVEKGAVQPSVNRLFALAELYGVSIEDFCDFIPDERAG